MSNLFIAGQIRAQEAKLLNLNRLDRMIGADSPEAAFRVMSELQYAEYLDDKTTSENFETVIQQGLLETKELLMAGTENNQVLRFIWLRFDINNIKRALKLKLLKGLSAIDDFTQANGFSNLGKWGQEKLESIVFQNKFTDIETPLQRAIQEASTLYEKKGKQFQFVEYALDQAYFSILKQIVDTVGTPFASRLFTLLVDQTNFKNIARSVLIRREKVEKEVWIPFGNLYYGEVADIERVSDFIKWAEKTPFSSIVENFTEGENTENLVMLEKYLDKQYQSFLENSVLGEIDTIQIPFVYMEKRLQNSRLLKFIMFAKFHGLTPDEIYKTVEKF